MIDPAAFSSLDTSALHNADFLRDPLRFERQSPYLEFFESCDTHLLSLALFQNALHDLLADYLNGDDCSGTGIALIFSLCRPKINRELFDACVTGMNRIAASGPAKAISFAEHQYHLENQGDYPAYMAQLLVDGYRFLSECIVHLKAPASNTDVITCGAHKDVVSPIQPISQMIDFWEKNRIPGARLLLHGSLASADYIPGTSDCDTAIIIGPELLFDFNALVHARAIISKSRKFLYLVDPLQHHGHIIIPAVDLSWYPQSRLNRTVLETSIVLSNTIAHPLVFRPRNDLFERVRAVCFSLRNLENNLEWVLRGQKPYYLKYYLSAAQMIPVLCNQLESDFRGKKSALEVMRDRIGLPAYALIDRCSFLRSYRPWKPWLSNRVASLLLRGSNPKRYHRISIIAGTTGRYAKAVKACIGSDSDIRRLVNDFHKGVSMYFHQTITAWASRKSHSHQQ